MISLDFCSSVGAGKRHTQVRMWTMYMKVIQHNVSAQSLQLWYVMSLAEQFTKSRLKVVGRIISTG